jgi:hypothetical protein
MLLLIDIFSINKGRGYENPSLEIIVTKCCSTGGFPLEEAYEHCFLNQSVISIAISYIISVYCEDYVGYFIVILPFLEFYLCSAYVRQHRYSNRGRTPSVTTHITRSKINTPMFSRGKTPTGKHPWPQPTRPLGAVY